MKTGHSELGKSPYARKGKIPFRYSDLCRDIGDNWKSKSPMIGSDLAEAKAKHRARMHAEAPLAAPVVQTELSELEYAE